MADSLTQDEKIYRKIYESRNFTVNQVDRNGDLIQILNTNRLVCVYFNTPIREKIQASVKCRASKLQNPSEIHDLIDLLNEAVKVVDLIDELLESVIDGEGVRSVEGYGEYFYAMRRVH